MMRKGWLLLILAASGLGCLSSGPHVDKEAQQAPPVRMAEAPPQPPPITADQVTETNANDIVQAMSREMDYDTVRPPAAPVMATTAANTMKP
jgi:hypothetical protein